MPAPIPSDSTRPRRTNRSRPSWTAKHALRCSPAAIRKRPNVSRRKPRWKPTDASRPTRPWRRAMAPQRRREPEMIDLSTDYLGLKLKNPLVPSASPLSKHLDTLLQLEDAGAARSEEHTSELQSPL